MPELPVANLSREGFAPYGEVVSLEGAQHYPINRGTTERFHDLTRIEVGAEGGRPLLNVFRAQNAPLPVSLNVMERHLLGSQCFFPLRAARMLVIVAPPGEFEENSLRAFLTAPYQGVNYAPGTWHHPLLALDGGGDFLVVDRGATTVDCEELALNDDWIITHLPG